MTKTNKLSAAESAAFKSEASFRKMMVRAAGNEADALYEANDCEASGETVIVELVSPSGVVLHSVESS